MLKETGPIQDRLEMVTIESLVPSDHLLRKIDAHIDFSFIRDRVEHLYCSDTGRPAFDPVLLFKMLFLGYIYGIRSERQLVKEIHVNMAYRWFLRLGITDKVPDASTLSRNRHERFHEAGIYEMIFDEIVLQAMKARLVGGKTLYTDSTHLKANANKAKYTKQLVAQSRADYLDDLDADIGLERKQRGKKR